MRVSRASAAVLALFQFAFFGWLMLTQRISTFSIVHIAFVAGAVAALVWVARPTIRGAVRAAECLTLAATGTVLLYPLASFLLHQSGSRESLAYLASHPGEAWPLVPVLALVAVLSNRLGGQRPGRVA